MNILLENVVNLNSVNLLHLLNLRNEPYIRQNMLHQSIITKESHFDWLEKLKHNSNKINYALILDSLPIGLVGFKLDTQSVLICEWFFYISEKFKFTGLEPSIEFFFLNYLFTKNKIILAKAIVLKSNKPVINLNLKFGFRILESNNNPEIESNFYTLQINKSNWSLKKFELEKKYSSIFKKFNFIFN